MKISIRKSGEENHPSRLIYVRDENAEGLLKTQEEIGRVYYSEEWGKTLGKEAGVWITEILFSKAFGIIPNWKFASTPEEATDLVEECVSSGHAAWEDLSEIERTQQTLISYANVLQQEVVQSIFGEPNQEEKNRLNRLSRYVESLQEWFVIEEELGRRFLKCHDRDSKPHYLCAGFGTHLEVILLASSWSDRHFVIRELVEKIQSCARECSYDKELHRQYSWDGGRSMGVVH
jgi:hypothetical protein